jgi:methylenetetrahydrofolate reductase (NADPH)
MNSTPGKGKVLVTGSEAYFRENIGNHLKGQFEVLLASSSDEGLKMARQQRPDAIVLGFLESVGTASRLYKKLRDGWITKHIPLLVVDISLGEHKDKVWTAQETMGMGEADYVSISPGDQGSIPGMVESADLIGKVHTKLDEKSNTLKRAVLDPATFCITWEQIPGRGAYEMQQEEIIDNLEKAAAGGRVHALSVTDNPGGNPAISTEMLCARIKRAGMEPLVHLACRDKNRNEIESMLYGLASEGVRNILCMTGDYPSNDPVSGRPKPVFDMDPINVLNLVKTMNEGLEYTQLRKQVTLAPTDFFAGVCVSPFKRLESELVTQYVKLKKKIQAGADFIITQVGYDARKLHELLVWLKTDGYDVPVFANLYVLPFGTARFMNSNMIPGCVVTDKLVNELGEERKAEDKGRSARLLRTSKQYAVAKGMGCTGVHIGGHGITYEMVEHIIDQGEELSGNWEDLVADLDYPQKNGFYFFEKDSKTGLNTEAPSEKKLKPSVPFKYRFSRIAHSLLFNEKSALFKTYQRLGKWADSSSRLRGMIEFGEHMFKVAFFDCMNCGDCALFDVAYLCPMSQCPKEQRNGPCGGGYNGWCEVYPDEQKCVWVQAYERLKKYKEEVADYIVPPCNWELRQTSSWLNFYLGRDHTAKRLGVVAPPDKGKKKS